MSDVHQWIGSAIFQTRQSGSNMYNEPQLYWEESPNVVLDTFAAMILKTTHIRWGKEFIEDFVNVWVRLNQEDWGLLWTGAANIYRPEPLPATIDSREQKVIYGFAGQEGNNNEDFQMVNEDRILIAYPGNMFGLPMYTWVMQEHQAGSFDEIGTLVNDTFIDNKVWWKAVVQEVQDQWRSLEEEKLELLMQLDDYDLDEEQYATHLAEIQQPVSFNVEIGGAQDDLRRKQDLWLWTIVPQPMLSLSGTVTKLPKADFVPVTIGDFSALNMVVSIGGMAERWLRERPINWSLPYSLIPWTDPWE